VGECEVMHFIGRNEKADYYLNGGAGELNVEESRCS